MEPKREPAHPSDPVVPSPNEVPTAAGNAPFDPVTPPESPGAPPPSTPAPEPVMRPDPPAEAAPPSPAASTASPVTVASSAGSTATAGKTDLGKRFIAALIDGITAAVLSFAVGMISDILGGLVGAAYWIVRDGLDVEFMRLRSLGKKVMKLNVVRLDGKPMDLETSFRRNWMFGLGALTTILLYIPFLGWAMIPVVGLIALGIGLFEIYKVVTDPAGRRWGDNMAGTKVIETNE